MATASLSTGTAADLLTFQKFDHLERGERLTRVATANQDWIVRDWDGETYVIKFDSNFSKKHLFTFTKKEDRVKAKAHEESEKPGQKDQEAENWRRAEQALLLGKIMKNLDKRAVANICNCGHPFSAPGANPKHPGGGACTGGGCGCTKFETPYALARKYVHKPTEDPLAGARTTKNTCIILNWIPRAEFEEVVVKSIQAFEKPTGWTKGNALAVPAGAGALSQRKLRWDFGLGRMGAIIKAEKIAIAPFYTFTNYRGCYIGAEKIGTDVGRQTWKIYHMETQAPYVPF